MFDIHFYDFTGVLLRDRSRDGYVKW